jgi:hypothetical protein
VANLKGDEARAAFITHFKEVQRLKTQLDQYTDLTEDNKATIEQVLPEENLRGFKGQYLETAKKLREQQGKGGDKPGTTDSVDQLDFEFVLFASAVIDYDYIMGLIARFSAKGPGKSKMTREELIGLISADAKFMNERDDIAEYIGTLKAGEGLSEAAIRDGYTRFKAEKKKREARNSPPSPHDLRSTASPPHPCPANLRGRHPRPHDLRWRTAQRPHGPAQTSAGKPAPRPNSPWNGKDRAAYAVPLL